MGDEDRASILARRARFIATTLAGLAIANCGDSDSPPQPCLDAPPPTGSTGSGEIGGAGGQGGEAGAGGEPQPCLTAPLGGGGMGGQGG